MTEQHSFAFCGVWIPATAMQALADGILPSTDVLVLAMVTALNDEGRGCYASNSYLGQKLCVGETTVRKALARLEKMGLVTRVLRKGQHRRIHATGGRAKTPRGVGKNAQGGRQKRLPDSTRKENKSVADCIRNESDGDSMPFFPEEPTPANTTEEDTANANILLAAIRKKLPGKRHNIIAWAKEFAILRRSVGAARIQAALAWYALHIGEEWVPQAYAASSFRHKFLAIEASARRHGGVLPEITPRAAAIAKRLLMAHWPKGSGDLVPAAVQVSLDNYTEFLATLEGLSFSGKADRFKAYVLRATPTPAVFVETWMNRVQKRLVGWEAWSGSLMSLAFSTESQEFQKQGRYWARTYTGSEAVWDILWKEYTE